MAMISPPEKVSARKRASPADRKKAFASKKHVSTSSPVL